MDRRKFLRLAGAAGLALSVPGAFEGLAEGRSPGGAADLAVVRGPSPGAATRAAVAVLGGMGGFVSRGDVVVVKPNIGWDRLPEHAANTNPEVVAAVVEMCLEAGASRVKVFDRTVNDPRRCYRQSGIMDAAQKAGADVRYVDDRKFKEVNVGGEALKLWPIYTEALEADKVINLPIAKHHGLAVLTLSMKNWMGVMGSSRSRIHQRLDESLADLARFMRPALTVLDAVRILTANGPQGGSLADVKRLDTVVAGTDQVAVDSYGATLFGLKGSDLGYVRAAERAGLGTSALDAINIKHIAL